MATKNLKLANRTNREGQYMESHFSSSIHLSVNDVVLRQRRCTSDLGRLLSRVLHVEAEPALPLRLKED